MQTPYEILEVAEDASDESIKKAYLKKVKEYPPEHNAEAFQRFRNAFEQIQNEKQRSNHRLFHREKVDLDCLLRYALSLKDIHRPDADLLAGALAESALDDLLKTEAST